MYKVISIALLFFSSINISHAIMRKIPVEKVIQEKVNKLVVIGKELHVASYTRRQKDINKALKDIVKQVDASKAIVLNDNIWAQHLLDLFEEIKVKSIEALELTKQEQRDVLKFVFEKMTRITQRYYVGKYRTFYCPKYQDLWVQDHWTVKNPIHPKSRCGKLAN